MNKEEENEILQTIRIRKLTPKECFRLQGFDDSAYEAASKEVSMSQLYKQAGNSITVDVLYYIYLELYEAMPYLFDDLRLGSFFSGIGAFECGLDRLYDTINSGDVENPQENNQNGGITSKIGIDKSINNTKEIDYANCITSREDREISNRKSEGTAILETLDTSYHKSTTPDYYVGGGGGELT